MKKRETLSERWRREARKLEGLSYNDIINCYTQTLQMCASEYDNTEAPDWLADLLDALGWQGGTIHQAIDAVKRLTEQRDCRQQSDCRQNRQHELLVQGRTKQHDI